MSNYLRYQIQGACYFFTVNCAERHNNHILTDNINLLRQSFRKVKTKHPFQINAIVILPEHLHCLWTLPAGDADYKTRWALIKANFSRALPTQERLSKSRLARGERGIWQRRYWEHLIRDAADFERHERYIHWNPVKHGWVKSVKEWHYSSFHAYVRQGIYTENWALAPDKTVEMRVGER